MLTEVLFNQILNRYARKRRSGFLKAKPDSGVSPKDPLSAGGNEISTKDNTAQDSVRKDGSPAAATKKRTRRILSDSDEDDDSSDVNSRHTEKKALVESSPEEKENHVVAETTTQHHGESIDMNGSDSPAKAVPKSSVDTSSPRKKGEQQESPSSKAAGEPAEEAVKAPSKAKVPSKMHPFFMQKPSVSKDTPKAAADKKDVLVTAQECDAMQVDNPAKTDISSSEAVATGRKGGPVSGPWKKGDKVPYSALCKTFEEIEATTKRLEITEYLTKFFVHVIQLSPDSLLECLYLCLNKICPEYEGKELGLGESILVKAIANATGRGAAKIKSEVEELGDLGTVAQNSKSKQMTLGTTSLLNVSKVFKTLKEISNFTGNASQAKKIEKINSLLVACKGNEAKFLIRSLEGKLRIGLAEKTALIALAHACVICENDGTKLGKDKLESETQEATLILKQVYCELPNYDLIIPALLKYGIKNLHEHCKLTPGIPLKPMLAHPTKSITEVLDRFENCTFTSEYKYDGERAQIHRCEDGKMFIYSRNSENLSAKYPDIMSMIPDVVKEGVTSFVLDCEAVAWDVKKQCILPFQVLSTRKRKDVNIEDIQVSVCVFAFDILYLNGEPLIKKTLRERRESLYSSFNESAGKFTYAKSMEGAYGEDLGCAVDVKKDYLNGVGDSLDLVVIGGYLGRGKRTGWFGGYLLACYDEENEVYQSICKIGTGFSEEQLKEHAEFFQKHRVESPPSYYQYSDTPNLRPDVWFEPVQVWEVKAADLSISPVHQAGIGLVDPAKGISLRFPRFIRVRDDKKVELATTAEQVASMYKAQNLNTSYGKNDGDDFEY
ncbi:tRNA ligase [Chytridiales sp. JEL 0842]|nr:tRNA ligase [Chytridiales sp. JEL 0842]